MELLLSRNLLAVLSTCNDYLLQSPLSTYTVARSNQPGICCATTLWCGESHQNSEYWQASWTGIVVPRHSNLRNVLTDLLEPKRRPYNNSQLFSLSTPVLPLSDERVRVCITQGDPPALSTCLYKCKIIRQGPVVQIKHWAFPISIQGMPEAPMWIYLFGKQTCSDLVEREREQILWTINYGSRGLVYVNS